MYKTLIITILSIILIQSLEMKAQLYDHYSIEELEKKVKQSKRCRTFGVISLSVGIPTIVIGVGILWAESFLNEPTHWGVSIIGGGLLLSGGGLLLTVIGASNKWSYERSLERKKSLLKLGVTSHGLGLRFQF